MSIVAAYVVPHPPLIVPAVGCGEERAIHETIDAYREVARRIAVHAPETIVVISPHAPLFRDCFHLSTGDAGHGDMGQFGAWDVSMNVPYDGALTSAMGACARKHAVPLCGSGMRMGQLDHATFVPLWFVNEVYEGYRMVRVGLSGLAPEEHRALGRCIAEAAEDLDRRVVVLASGDLSHKLKADGPYGFAPEGPKFDREITALFAAGDFEGLFAFDEAFADAAAECGLRSFQIMAGALEGVSCTHELLSYEGPFGVGYAVAAFEIENSKPADHAVVAREDIDAYVALARASVEAFVRTGHPLDQPQLLPAELLDERAGVFVSLHKKGQLRGCIGTIAATCDCIAQEIVRNGVASASEDPRFAPVEDDELDDISYSVDVLLAAEPILSVDMLDPARYGVIVTKGRRRGLLLPNLEGVNTVEEQVSIAKRKAGIDPGDSDVRLERFEVVRHDRGGEARGD